MRNVTTVSHFKRVSRLPVDLTDEAYKFLILPTVQPFTERATDRFINRLRLTELKMSLKFSIACGLFQLLLVILFSVLTNYGDHASPPHKRKGATETSPNVSETLPVNDVSIYYPSKSSV